jgi:hypothetical protein
MLIKEGLGSLVMVLLLGNQAKQEMQAAAARQVEIVIAHPQTGYLLARVVQGMEDSLEVLVIREIIRVSAQEWMAVLMKQVEHAQAANVISSLRYAMAHCIGILRSVVVLDN